MIGVEVNIDLQAVQDRQEVVRAEAQLLSLREVREAVTRLVEVGVALVREAAISQVGLATVVRVREYQGQAQVALRHQLGQVVLPGLEVQVLLLQGDLV